MNKSKLLNEVISDAKAVKDTAFKTAVQVLKEEFAPTMSRMISQKLAEDGELDDEELDNEAPAAPPVEDEMPEDEFAAEAPEEDFAPEMEDEDDADLEEILRELQAEAGSEEAPEPPVETAPVEDEEEITSESLDQLIREMEDELSEGETGFEEEDETSPVAESNTKRIRQLRKENAQLKKDVKEAYEAILLQKNTLLEVNLLNAKLLYLQKLSNKFKLAGKEKQTVMEALDNANSKREADLIYATIFQNLRASSTKVTSRINESASRPTRTVGTKPASSAQFGFVERFQQLANINKNKKG